MQENMTRVVIFGEKLSYFNQILFFPFQFGSVVVTAFPTVKAYSTLQGTLQGNIHKVLDAAAALLSECIFRSSPSFSPPPPSLF
jgi:hypothetical protein